MLYAFLKYITIECARRVKANNARFLLAVPVPLSRILKSLGLDLKPAYDSGTIVLPMLGTTVP